MHLVSSLMSLPIDVLWKCLSQPPCLLTGTVAVKGGSQKTWLVAVWNLLWTCKTLYSASLSVDCPLWDALCKTLCLHGKWGVPSRVVVGLYSNMHCSKCRVVTPAPVRWGFQLWMCAWCFENCTVPIEAVRQLGGTQMLRLHSYWTEERLITVYRGKLRHKRRSVVYLLSDICGNE